MAPLPAPPTFFPHTHAKLSPHTYLTAHLTSSPPTRPSGRSPTSSRPIALHTGSLTHAHGSSVLRMGDTAVVTGVRGEVLLASSVASAKPLGGDEGGGGERSGRGKKRKRGDKQGREELMELGLLVPNIELNTGCSPDYLPGGPPSGAAQVLSQRLLTGLHVTDLVDIDDLRIWGASSDIEDEGDREGEGMDIDTEDGGVTLAPGATPEDEKTEGRRKELKAFWTLYIDVLLLSLDHGPQGAFDAIWLSVIAALKDTVFPKAWWDADQEAVLCDPDFEQGTKLVLREDTPVALTCGVFHADRGLGRYAGGQEKGERWLLSDLDAFEEELCAEVGTVIVGGKGRVVRIEKSGGEALGVEGVRELVKRAEERRGECLGVLEGKG